MPVDSSPLDRLHHLESKLNGRSAVSVANLYPRLADTLEALVSERTDIHADKPTFTTVMDGTPGERRFERKHLPVTIPVSSETRRYRPHQGHLERQPTKGTCHEIVLRAIFGDTEDQRHKSGELTGETGARKSQNRIAPTDDVVAVQCRLEVQR